MDNVLERVIGEIDAAEADSKLDVDSADWKVRSGMAMRQRQGEERLPRLKEKYREVVKPRGFAIFAIGPFAEKFAEIAKGEGDVVVVRADRLYRKLAKEVWEAMSSKPGIYTSNESAALVTTLRAMAADLGLNAVGVVRAEGFVHIESEDALSFFLRDIVRKSENKDDLNRIVIESDAAAEALAIRYTHAVVPVIVLASTEEERAAYKETKSLFSGTTFVVKVDEEPTVDSVGKELAGISKKLKALRSKE